MEPLSSDQLLVFWVQLSVILIVARGLGSLMRRLGQPSVVGELAAGLLLGPTLLARVAPEAYAWLFPDQPVHSGLLLGLAWIGAALLLTVTGFETDLGLLRRLGRQSLWVSTGSLVVPLALGIAVGWVMPELFIGAAGDRLSFALFAGIALAISALPVVARILMEMDLMRRNFGQVTIAAAIANDLVGYLLVGAVAGLVAAGGLDLADLGTTLGLFALLVAAVFLVGQRIVDKMLRTARSQPHGRQGAVTVVLTGTLVLAALAQAIGVEAVLGALLAGIVFGRSRYLPAETRETVEHLTNAFVAPLFFATAGLFVDLGLLLDPQVAFWAALVLAAATLSKLVGSYLGAWISGLAPQERLALGVGLNARGALQVVIATVGLGIGVLNETSYTVIMVTAIVTSLMTPPLLRAVLSRFETPPEEQARLDREEMLSRSIIARTTSALQPTRGGANSVIAAQLLDQALQPEATVTLLTVRTPDQGREARRVLDRALDDVLGVFTSRAVDRVDTQRADLAEAIAAEASLGYGLVALGHTEPYAGSEGMSPMLARTIARCPVPMLLVQHGEDVTGRQEPLDLQRILVSIGGDYRSRAAQEVAYTLGERTGAAVDALHVVEQHGGADQPEAPAGPQDADLRRHFAADPFARHAPAGGATEEGDVSATSATSSLGLAARVLIQADELARQFDCAVDPITRVGTRLGSAVASVADERESDLIVVGATARATGDGLFLGYPVEYLLERARQTVLVVVFPSAR